VSNSFLKLQFKRGGVAGSLDEGAMKGLPEPERLWALDEAIKVVQNLWETEYRRQQNNRARREKARCEESISQI
jgi:hypothetical protein